MLTAGIFSKTTGNTTVVAVIEQNSVNLFISLYKPFVPIIINKPILRLLP